jgi:uncharacterized protein YdiU (UPF0061 family)
MTWALTSYSTSSSNGKFEIASGHYRVRAALASLRFLVGKRLGVMNERRPANPAFIPRNHLVEEATSAAVNVGDFQPFESSLTVLSMPYEDQPPSAATSIRRSPIKSCTKRFAALDQGWASSTPASRQLLRPGELLPHRSLREPS